MSSAAMVQEPAATEPIRLELTRVIKAARPRVFDAWTRPEVMRQWLAPHKMQTPGAKTDPVVGGAYRITMQGPEPEEQAERPSYSVNRLTTVTGRYTRVDPYDVLQFTWLPAWETVESVVTLSFRDLEGGTEVKLVHDQIASAGSCTGYQQGWTGCLDKLGALLGA